MGGQVYDVIRNPAVFPFVVPIAVILIGGLGAYLSAPERHWDFRYVYLGQQFALSAASVGFIGFFKLSKNIANGEIRGREISELYTDMGFFLILWILSFAIILVFHRSFSHESGSPIVRYATLGIASNAIGFGMVVLAVQTVGRVIWQ